MCKLIIWIGGKPLLNGYRIRDFHWTAAHNCYIYEGKEIDEADFNAKYEKAARNHLDLHPKVRVVAKSAPEAVKAVPTVSTISASREITLEEAEAIVAQLAPERLKKRAGRPPRMMEVA